jgi:hypothetical protein
MYDDNGLIFGEKEGAVDAISISSATAGFTWLIRRRLCKEARQCSVSEALTKSRRWKPGNLDGRREGRDQKTARER